MFCTCVAWVCLRLCKEEGSSPVCAITERRDMGLYDVSLSGFGMGTMLVNFHMCGIKSSFQHAREECESQRAYVTTSSSYKIKY